MNQSLNYQSHKYVFVRYREIFTCNIISKYKLLAKIMSNNKFNNFFRSIKIGIFVIDLYLKIILSHTKEDYAKKHFMLLFRSSFLILRSKNNKKQL